MRSNVRVNHCTMHLDLDAGSTLVLLDRGFDGFVPTLVVGQMSGVVASLPEVMVALPP
jgi:hypothetical protein